eukprot:9484349-Pyramimonas_sp.AAC.1
MGERRLPMLHPRSGRSRNSLPLMPTPSHASSRTAPCTSESGSGRHMGWTSCLPPMDADAPTWKELPSLTVHDLRHAIRSFSLSSPPRGPPAFHPRRSSTCWMRLSVGWPRCSRSLKCAYGFPQTACIVRWSVSLSQIVATG